MKVSDNLDCITAIRVTERPEHVFAWTIIVELTKNGEKYNAYQTRITTHEEVERILDVWEIPPELFFEKVRGS